MTVRELEEKSYDHSYVRAEEQRIADAYSSWKLASRACQHRQGTVAEQEAYMWSKSTSAGRDVGFTPAKRSIAKHDTPPKQQPCGRKNSLILHERSHSGWRYYPEKGSEESQHYFRGGGDSANVPPKRESSSYHRHIAQQGMGDGGDDHYRHDEQISGDERYRALEEKSFARNPNSQESSLERQGPTRRQSRSIHNDPRAHTSDALAGRQNIALYRKRERCDDDYRQRDRTIGDNDPPRARTTSTQPRSHPYYRDGQEERYANIDGADDRSWFDSNDGCGSIAIRRPPIPAIITQGWARGRHCSRSRSQGPPRQAQFAEESAEAAYEIERRRERPRREEVVFTRHTRIVRDVRCSDAREERHRGANRKDASERTLDAGLKSDSRKANNDCVSLASSSSSTSSASDDGDHGRVDTSNPTTSVAPDPARRNSTITRSNSRAKCSRVKPTRRAQRRSLSPSPRPTLSPSRSPSSGQAAKVLKQRTRRAAERTNSLLRAAKQRSRSPKSALARDRERPDANHTLLERESDTKCPPSPRPASPYPPSLDNFELVDSADWLDDDLSVAESASCAKTPTFSPVYLAIACGANPEEIDAGVPIEDTIIADGDILSPWIPDGLQRVYKQCVTFENHSLVLVPTEDHVAEAKQWFSGKTDGPRSLTVFNLTTMNRIL